MSENKLAILLPHYNNSKGLALTLNSLLNEEAKFTVFIFDDGSDDFEAIEALVKRFGEDLDIHLERNERNLGITSTLNNGVTHILKLKKFQFIARLDAGDKCMNNRLAIQHDFLSKNEDVGLVSSWVQFVDEQRNPLFVFKPPKDHKKLKNVLHLYNPFIHPAIMLRASVFDKVGRYPEDYKTLQDHAFFFKVIKVFRTAVIQEILLEYEVSKSAISSLRRKSQAGNRIKLLCKEFKFGYYPIIGLIRSLITYLTPQSVLIALKKNIFYR